MKINSNILVISSVGSNLTTEYKDSVYSSWNTKDMDSVCVKYNPNDTFDYNKYFNETFINKDFKFPNVLFASKKIPLNKYEYIVCIDDDLFFTIDDTIVRTTDYMSKYNIDICSISNDCKGKKSSYDIMNSHELINEIWITNFCEMGCLFFKTNILQSILETYENEYSNVKDYGIDHLIFNIVDHMTTKTGIIKNLTYYNPLQKPRDTKIFGWIINKSLKNLNRIEPTIIETISLEDNNER